MELDKTKIYSLEGMSRCQVEEFLYKNNIIWVWLESCFEFKDVADDRDLIDYVFGQWNWHIFGSEITKEIIKAKDL